MTPSTAALPSNVQSRVAARLEKIQPHIQAIADDLGEFGLNYMTIDMGSVKIAIGSSTVTFHDHPNNPPHEQPATFT